MPKGCRLMKYRKRLKKRLPLVFLICFQAAVAFGAIMTGLEAGRYLNLW